MVCTEGRREDWRRNTDKYLAHFGDDRSLPHVADVHDSLETAADGLVVVQYTDVGFKLEARWWIQLRTHQHHPLETRSNSNSKMGVYGVQNQAT